MPKFYGVWFIAISLGLICPAISVLEASPGHKKEDCLSIIKFWWLPITARMHDLPLTSAALQTLLEKTKESSHFVITDYQNLDPGDLRFLYQNAHNPAFKIFAFQILGPSKMPWIEFPEEEFGTNVLLMLAKMVKKDRKLTASLDKLWPTLLIYAADFGSASKQNLALLEKIYRRYDSYTQHLALSAMMKIKARVTGNELSWDLVWKESPIANQIHELYTQEDRLWAAISHFEDHRNFFAPEDIIYLIGLCYTHQNFEMIINMIHVAGHTAPILNQYHPLSFIPDRKIVSAVLQYIGQKFEKLGSSRGVPFPSKQHLDFVSSAVDFSAGSALETILNRDGPVRTAVQNALEELKK